MEGNFNFKGAAQKAILPSSIMMNKRKLETDEIINKELTIIAFDFAPKSDKYGQVDVFGIVVFAEIPECYYCVGSVFTKACKAWAVPFSSPAEASAALEREGGVKVKFKHSRIGDNFIDVEIL